VSDEDLLRLGFVRSDDGSFLLLPTAGMRFAPIGRFLKIQVAIGNGNVVEVVVARAALKLAEGVRL
jgi:hypothetical protein